MLHVIGINYNHYDKYESIEKLLVDYFPLRGWASGVQGAGAQVTVFQRFRHDYVWEDAGIPYHFVREYTPTSLFPLRLHGRVQELCRQNSQAKTPTIIHLNGLLFPWQLRLLRATIPRHIPIMGQHHGSFPWATGVRRGVQRWGLRCLAGFMFSAQPLADSWQEAGLITPDQQVTTIMETSSSLVRLDKAEASRDSGMVGNPVIFWAGNLDANKDPLTILAGFAELLPHFPQARLYMAYRFADLLPQVENFIQAQGLGERVTLLGKIPYAKMGMYYSSADIFVQGSGREGSGIALLDAMACGAIPVVTDIPAFREMLGDGLGMLWAVGEMPAFSHALQTICQNPLPPQSEAIYQHFQNHFTFAELGKQCVDFYRHCCHISRKNEK